MKYQKMSELNTLDNLLKEKIEGKTILVRVDLNVPMKNGKIMLWNG
mgnify:FL=1